MNHLKFQLANIIWGGGEESGDHIVPYPEASEDYPKKKQWNQETATIKSTEPRTAGVKIDLHGRKLESSSDLDTNADITTSGFGVDLWPDLSLSNPAKTDQDSMGTEVSNSLTEIKQFKASRGGKNVNYSNKVHLYRCIFLFVCVCVAQAIEGAVI